MNLRTLRESNIRRDEEWDPNNKITLSFRGNELAGETGEACNFIKKIERTRLGLLQYSNGFTEDQLKEKLAKELADVIICADLIGMDLGINLEHAVRDKFNNSSEKMGLKTRIR